MRRGRPLIAIRSHTKIAASHHRLAECVFACPRSVQTRTLVPSSCGGRSCACHFAFGFLLRSRRSQRPPSCPVAAPAVTATPTVLPAINPVPMPPWGARAAAARADRPTQAPAAPAASSSTSNPALTRSMRPRSTSAAPNAELPSAASRNSLATMTTATAWSTRAARARPDCRTGASRAIRLRATRLRARTAPKCAMSWGYGAPVSGVSTPMRHR